MERITGVDNALLSTTLKLPKLLASHTSKYIWEGDIGWGSIVREIVSIQYKSLCKHAALFLLESVVLLVTADNKDGLISATGNDAVRDIFSFAYSDIVDFQVISNNSDLNSIGKVTKDISISNVVQRIECHLRTKDRSIECTITFNTNSIYNLSYYHCICSM